MSCHVVLSQQQNVKWQQLLNIIHIKRSAYNTHETRCSKSITICSFSLISSSHHHHHDHHCCISHFIPHSGNDNIFSFLTKLFQSLSLRTTSCSHIADTHMCVTSTVTVGRRSVLREVNPVSLSTSWNFTPSSRRYVSNGNLKREQELQSNFFPSPAQSSLCYSLWLHHHLLSFRGWKEKRERKVLGQEKREKTLSRPPTYRPSLSSLQVVPFRERKTEEWKMCFHVRRRFPSDFPSSEE